ncbi:MAG: DNA alkylation repair protein [Chitinophagales bacterium]
MSNIYVLQLQEHFAPHTNPYNAPAMSKYMRNLFPYLGIKSPQRNALFRSFIATNGLPEYSQLAEIVKELWELPEREFQYIAIDLVGKWVKKLQVEDIRLVRI